MKEQAIKNVVIVCDKALGLNCLKKLVSLRGDSVVVLTKTQEITEYADYKGLKHYPYEIEILKERLKELYMPFFG